ncbi:hypothetical protein ACW9UR_19885 [Halovulum sp. GXIMD14794]
MITRFIIQPGRIGLLILLGVFPAANAAGDASLTMGPMLEALTSQGFSEIEIVRADGQVIVDAEGRGLKRRLVFETCDGRLVSDEIRDRGDDRIDPAPYRDARLEGVGEDTGGENIAPGQEDGNDGERIGGNTVAYRDNNCDRGGDPQGGPRASGDE